MNSVKTNSIDIDIGGTFTDCSVQFNGRRASAKSPTTHYNLSVGFMRALEKAIGQFNLGADTLLPQTDIVRYSTTLAMNKLLERKGSKLSLMTTVGFEDSVLIGKGAQWTDGLSRQEARNLALVAKPEPLIPRERIVGIKERMDHKGNILRPLDENDVHKKLHSLVDQGVRGVVVSLLWGHKNPSHEIRIREIIAEEYPEATLGFLPVVLSHEVMPKKFEYQRTMTAILNAYLRESMIVDLGDIRKELREMGYRHSILIVHNMGGMAELMKTTAVETYNGGPVAGIAGSLEIAKLYGSANVITTDMGGTSYDVGIISDNRTPYSENNPVIDRWMVHTAMIESKSVGAGGGSIAVINQALGGKLEVGPRSAGAMPGPACYNFGGTEPTVTDADVVLGYINPDFFHGGRIQLECSLALKAIQEKIAAPQGWEVEEAAAKIRKLVDGNMGNILFKETVLKGYDPREFIIFSFGGAGPTHCCGYAQASQIRRVVAFPFSPIFCAFSASLLDIRHIHERSQKLIVLKPDIEEPVLDLEQFNQLVKKLIQQAVETAQAEGLQTDKLVFSLELDMKHGRQLHVNRIKSPKLLLQSAKDVHKLLETFFQEYGKAFRREANLTLTFRPPDIYLEGGVSIENFILHTVYPLKNIHFPKFPIHSSKPATSAKKGNRPVYWEEEKGFVNTPIYCYPDLKCGNIIDGPAVIEADDTTFVLPPKWIFKIDEYMNNLIERED